jgi:hypothetical protein
MLFPWRPTVNWTSQYFEGRNLIFSNEGDFILIPHPKLLRNTHLSQRVHRDEGTFPHGSCSWSRSEVRNVWSSASSKLTDRHSVMLKAIGNKQHYLPVSISSFLVIIFPKYFCTSILCVILPIVNEPQIPDNRNFFCLPNHKHVSRINH